MDNDEQRPTMDKMNKWNVNMIQQKNTISNV